MKTNELPAAVQATVQRQASGREIVDIDRETHKGRTVYEVEFRQSGKNEEIVIAEDGSVVAAETKKTKRFAEWFKGTELSDTPAAVQDTIRREAAGLEIVDIDREGTKQNPVYEVEIRGADDRKFEILVAANGDVLRDSRRPNGISMK